MKCNNSCGNKSSCGHKHGCSSCGNRNSCGGAHNCGNRCERCGSAAACCAVAIHSRINRHIPTLKEMVAQSDSVGCKHALHLFEQLSSWICEACAPSIEEVRQAAHKIIEKMRCEKTYDHIPEKLKCLFHEIVFCKKEC